jgi:hypothetical protein
VFYSRQLEVLFEDELFHWVTNRAVHRLIQEGRILSETRQLAIGSVAPGFSFLQTCGDRGRFGLAGRKYRRRHERDGHHRAENRGSAGHNDRRTQGQGLGLGVKQTGIFVRGLDRVTLDEISRAVVGRPERELRPIELAIITAAIEPTQWRKENGAYYRV